MRVAVVTPTIASDTLVQCLRSVQGQDYEDIVHYIAIDGSVHRHQVNDMIFSNLKNKQKRVESIALSENIGKGWYGHRVYAACSFLVNADIICYLDEDNWFESNHVSSLVKKIGEGNSWAYSFRKICDKEGNFICNDECESLGKWPVHFNPNVFHIDTSSFAVRRDVAIQIGHAWYGQWGADRQFFGALKEYFPKFDCSHEYSLCYRLDGNSNSVTRDFFEQGNKANYNNYKGKLPWVMGNKH